MAAITATMFALHFSGIYLILNRNMLPAILSFLGLMLAFVGYFERDKKKRNALIALIVHSAFLLAWIFLFVSSLKQ